MVKEKKKIFATNRSAYHDYHVLQKFEAGLELKGTEVKSVRAGKVNLKESYAQVVGGEVFLINCHISPYSHGNIENHDPLREKKLLLHKREIARLERETTKAGLTITPLKMYLKGKHIKIEIALAKGKKLHDKREAAKKKILRKEVDEALHDRK